MKQFCSSTSDAGPTQVVALALQHHAMPRFVHPVPAGFGQWGGRPGEGDTAWRWLLDFIQTPIPSPCGPDLVYVVFLDLPPLCSGCWSKQPIGAHFIPVQVRIVLSKCGCWKGQLTVLGFQSTESVHSTERYANKSHAFWLTWHQSLASRKCLGSGHSRQYSLAYMYSSADCQG